LSFGFVGRRGLTVKATKVVCESSTDTVILLEESVGKVYLEIVLQYKSQKKNTLSFPLQSSVASRNVF